MASIFQPGRETQSTTQVASPARREAVLAILQALGGRSIGGYGGKRGKPAMKLDLAALLKTIQENPEALNKVVNQTGRPASPSTFQNLSSGLVTALLLGKALTDEDSKGGSMGGSALDLLRKLGIDIGGGDAATGTGLGVLAQDAGGSATDFFSNLGGSGSSDGTYGVNMADEGADVASWLSSLWS